MATSNHSHHDIPHALDLVLAVVEHPHGLLCPCVPVVVALLIPSPGVPVVVLAVVEHPHGHLCPCVPVVVLVSDLGADGDSSVMVLAFVDEPLHVAQRP